ncbi:MAG: FTR1 family protein [Thermoactinomyces sp.]
MLSTLFLTFREGFEAALIIGIILTHLVKIERKDLTKYVYLGIIVGVIGSLIGGFLSFSEAKEAAEGSEEWFEGVMMLVASGLIAYFILWLHRNHQTHSTIEKKVERNSSGFGLFILALLSVFREGMELVIFNLTQINQKATNLTLGSILGILLAIVLAYAIFKTTVKLNLQFIFKALGIVIIFIGGELFGEGILKLFEFKGEAAEMIPMIVFDLSTLYLFLKNDITRIIGKKSATKKTDHV